MPKPVKATTASATMSRVAVAQEKPPTRLARQGVIPCPAAYIRSAE
jgi:hypothetical protein